MDDTRRLVYWTALGVVVTGTFYMVVAALATRQAHYFVDAAIGLVALFFVLRLGNGASAIVGCAACGGVEDAVRSPGGRRLWTCRRCGAERPRRRPRVDVGSQS